MCVRPKPDEMQGQKNEGPERIRAFAPTNSNSVTTVDWRE